MNETVTLGKFGSTHGVRGWIKVYSYTEPLDNILNYSDWMIKSQNQSQTLKITDSKLQNDHFLVKIDGINSPEEAQKLTNSLIEIKREALPELEAGEHYWDDLKGLSVMDLNGTLLGTVDHVFETGANDILFVIAADGQERLIPYIDDVVKSVDMSNRQITVDWDKDF